MTHNDEHLTPFTSDFEDDLGEEEEIKKADPEIEDEDGDSDSKITTPGGNDNDENFGTEEF